LVPRTPATALAATSEAPLRDHFEIDHTPLEQRQPQMLCNKRSPS
jgi:hypothetical protein